MVSLLKKNPAVAINIILGRLQQKVDEWCALCLALFSLLQLEKAFKQRVMAKEGLNLALADWQYL